MNPAAGMLLIVSPTSNFVRKKLPKAEVCPQRRKNRVTVTYMWKRCDISYHNLSHALGDKILFEQLIRTELNLRGGLLNCLFIRYVGLLFSSGHVSRCFCGTSPLPFGSFLFCQPSEDER
jgi:hypothetical protein